MTGVSSCDLVLHLILHVILTLLTDPFYFFSAIGAIKNPNTVGQIEHRATFTRVTLSFFNFFSLNLTQIKLWVCSTHCVDPVQGVPLLAGTSDHAQ